MNVTEALNTRYTCRAFKSDPVPEALLLQTMGAADRTPSWANTQPWEIYIAGGEVLENLRQSCLENCRNGIEGNSDLPTAHRARTLGIDRNDEMKRRELFEQNHRFFDAPAVVYLCMEKSLTAWSIHDLGMMAQSIMLAAQERRVNSAIAYNLVIYPDLIRPALEIPENLSIIIGIALGYADAGNPQNSFRSSRRPLREVVKRRGF